jgi:trimeric autotransporter adhesin
VAVLTRVALPWRALVASAVLSAAVGLAVAARLSVGERPAALPTVHARATHYGSVSSLPFSAQAQISAAVGAETGAYRLTRSHAGFLTVSQGQHVTARFTQSGVRLRSGTTALELRLRSVGYGGSLQTVEQVAPSVRANRATYAHPGLSEWYVNGPLGVEQGFTIARAPSGPTTGPLTVSMALSGDARAALGRGGRSLVLTHVGGPTLRYDGLAATDARGRALRSWLELRGGVVKVRVDARGASYPLTIDPFVQQGPRLTGSGLEGLAPEFGSSVAISADGNTALVGAPQDNSVGAAFVFTRAGGVWMQQGGKLTGAGASAGARFGSSVALSADGNTALVGGFTDSSNVGAAWVFARSGSTWTSQSGKLTGSVEIGEGRFGLSVALSGNGNTALIGGPTDNGLVGAAWEFVRSGGTWALHGGKLTGGEETVNGEFGQSVALSFDGDRKSVV